MVSGAKECYKSERIERAHPSGGLTFDEKLVRDQRQIVLKVIKQLGWSILDGKDIINQSLPVNLFLPSSFLQRIADSFIYADYFLCKAAVLEDPLERFKLMIAFHVSGLLFTCLDKKPFNPILGETYEATSQNGSKLYCEQISHHPPVTAWQLFGADDAYKYEGAVEVKATFSGTGVVGHQKGPHTIKLSDGYKCEFSAPKCKVSGIIVGERIMDFSDTIHFKDSNGLQCELTYGAYSGLLKSWFSSTWKPSDYFHGVIYKASHLGKRDIRETLCEVTGSWLGQISFDEVEYWSIKSPWAPKIEWSVPTNPAPSDSRHREDLVALENGDLENSRLSKIKLEELQRLDARMRQEGEYGATTAVTKENKKEVKKEVKTKKKEEKKEEKALKKEEKKEAKLRKKIEKESRKQHHATSTASLPSISSDLSDSSMASYDSN